MIKFIGKLDESLSKEIIERLTEYDEDIDCSIKVTPGVNEKIRYNGYGGDEFAVVRYKGYTDTVALRDVNNLDSFVDAIFESLNLLQYVAMDGGLS